MICTRCEGTGFINLHQLPESILEQFDDNGDPEWLANWLKENDQEYDTQVCDCCGDGEGWYGTPGEHYNSDEPPGKNGPYGYNGGLCKCH